MRYSLKPHIVEMLMRLADDTSPELEIAVRLVGERLEEGHVCLDLGEMAGRELISPEGERVSIPALPQWRASLMAGGVVGSPGEFSPLILDSHRLYFHRYHEYERLVADFINSRRGKPADGLDLERLKLGLDRLFPTRKEIDDEPDWQQVAALRTLTGRFTIISGGPGTGKTTTVARILALLLEQKPETRIRLGAPTGKAAARLQDSLASAGERLPLDSKVLKAFPAKVSTIHRLLGKARGRPKFGRDNKLAADIVIIDEASMVDLPLMAELMTAVPESCSLVLLGDRHQLASVQPGAVFADLCHGSTQSITRKYSIPARDIKDGNLQAYSGNPESGCLVELRANYRFAEDSDIGLLSRLVKKRSNKEVLELLASPERTGVRWYDLDSFTGSPAKEIITRTKRHFSYLNGFSDPEEALAEMVRTVILCGLRHGPFGSVVMNRLVEESLGVDPRRHFYHGRPIMILRNDYKRELYNGDTGIVLRDPERGGELRCFFPNRRESISPSLLPEHETAYAMTVHKSQGSEYDNVVLVLSDATSPVFTGELLYTGITRARRFVEIWSSQQVLLETVARKISRRSGLGDRLNPDLQRGNEPST